MPRPLPTFYCESRWNHFGVSLQPKFDHPFWQKPNTVPEVRIFIENQTIEELTDWFILEYSHWKFYFNASGNMPNKMDRWVICPYPLGSELNTATSGLRALLNNSNDMTTGWTALGTNPRKPNYALSSPNANEYLVPWATSGILWHQEWGSQFWPMLKTKLAASGIPNFELVFLTSENGYGDDFFGQYATGFFNATGWVDRVLNGPLATSTSHLVDGERTFRQYWDEETKLLNSSNIPSVDQIFTANPALPSNRAPEVQPIQHKWSTARELNWDYARFKGIVEPMQNSFGPIPLTEYQGYTNSVEFPVIFYYPSYPKYLMKGRFLTPWQCPDFYMNYPDPFNAQEDGTPPYWPSDVGWQAVFNKGEIDPGSPYSNEDFAALAASKQRVLAVKRSNPTKPTCPLISTRGFLGLKKDMVIDFIKYCYLNEIDKFYIWENNYLIVDGEIDFWDEVVTEINNWVLALPEQPSAVLNKSGTITKLGGSYMKR